MSRVDGFVGSLAGAAKRMRGPASDRPLPTLTSLDENLLGAIGDLVTWHERNGDVVRAGGASGLTGRTPDALLGSGLFSQVHVPDRPAFLKAIAEAAGRPDPVCVEFRLRVAPAPGDSPAQARLLWVEMRALGLAGRSDDAGVVCFTRDASSLHKHAADLETARLEAVRASEMKGRFLATVSHELRTPLNAIIGFSELLSADHPYVVAEDQRKEYATIIKESGHHLLEVVNTLLDVSKIESGNFTLSPEPFSLAELATGCCDLMRLKAEQAGIELLGAIAPDMPELVADRRACRQILINLLSNAVKFTPAGGRVTVAIGREGERAVLSVSDSGIGIRASDLPRLGDPFFQAGDLHRRPHEGTGLGLSVVRGLVGLHDGTMSVESGPGAGTTVTVSLPLNGRSTAGPGRPVPVVASARLPPIQPERKIA